MGVFEEVNVYTVYKHICPNEKCYIGVTKQIPNRRWNGGRGYICCSAFYNAILKYKWNNIKHEILMSGLTKEEAEEAEISLIAEYRSNERDYGYNLEGGGHTQKVISDETRQKLREYGLNQSEETRRKIADKTRVNVTGRKSNEHTRQLLSEIGRKRIGSKNPKSRSVCKINALTGCTLEIYESIGEACRINRYNHGGIVQCCQGKRNTAYNYKWRYKNEK